MSDLVRTLYFPTRGAASRGTAPRGRPVVLSLSSGTSAYGPRSTFCSRSPPRLMSESASVPQISDLRSQSSL